MNIPKTYSMLNCHQMMTQIMIDYVLLNSSTVECSPYLCAF